MKKIKIIADGFGGDNSPASVILGCYEAVKAFDDIEISITGDEKELKTASLNLSIDPGSFKFIPAKTVMPADKDPSLIRSEYKESSLLVAVKALKEYGDALVCAGNTGALTVGASAVLGRITGIKRAALSPVMPSFEGCFMLIDAGANLNCKPNMLCQFAVMGSVYLERVMNVKNPKIGLLNIGAEPSKGPDTLKETYRLLKGIDSLNFIGNVEARDVPRGICDVVVSDGFAGNMVLKTMEGTCLFFIEALKDIFMSSIKTKTAAILLKKDLKALKHKMDYTEYGGAMLLGIRKPVIKAHGSSDANAVKNAIRQARLCVKREVISKTADKLSGLKELKDGD